jgi:hypothetical protein
MLKKSKSLPRKEPNSVGLVRLLRFWGVKGGALSSWGITLSRTRPSW